MCSALKTVEFLSHIHIAQYIVFVICLGESIFVAVVLYVKMPPKMESSKAARMRAATAICCKYCNQKSDDYIVQCLDCGRYFCNVDNGDFPSHIVQHIMVRRHMDKGILLCGHNHALKDTIIECSQCHELNIFTLRWVNGCREKPSNGNPKLLCRKCDVDLEHSNPIVRDQHLDELLASTNGKPKPLTRKEAMQLEFPSKKKSGAVEEAVLPLPVIPVTFVSFNQYVRIMKAHLHAEYITETRDARRRAANVSGSVVMTRLFGADEVPCLKVECPSNSKENFVKGVLVSCKVPGSKEELQGRIVDIEESDDVKMAVIDLVLSTPDAINRMRSTTQFVVKEEVSGATRDRCMNTLSVFPDCVSPFLLHTVLGDHEAAQASLGEVPPPPCRLPKTFVRELNPSQQDAAKSALTAPLTLIQGPPGTGKTTVSTTIVYHLFEMYKQPILVCAPSNVAADHLAERLVHLGMDVLRVLAPSREDRTPASTKVAYLHQVVDCLIRDLPLTSKLRELHEKLRSSHYLSEAERRKYLRLRSKLEMDVISDADVVCSTCSTAGSMRFNKTVFRHVLIDEAAQAIEPEALIPLTHGAERVVLVGDQKQMGPLIFSLESRRKGFNRSLFGRLIETGLTPKLLNTQYRMHSCLSRFPSAQFYSGQLINGVRDSDRRSPHGVPWPNCDCPKFFCHVEGIEETGSTGMSFLNCAETVMTEKVLDQLISNKVKPEDVGIITPYEAQRRLLLDYLGRRKSRRYRAVEVANVDSFQGREKKYIIVLCVRSNMRGVIGFLRDQKRLNVTITRAQFGLIMIGNAMVLARDPLWHLLLESFVADGACGAPSQAPWLIPSTVALPEADKQQRNEQDNDIREDEFFVVIEDD